MSVQVFIDWKFVLALGGAAAIIIVSTKIEKTAAENILTHMVDSAKERTVTCSEVY